MRRNELHPHTAAINKAQKTQSKKARNQALIWLATTFPQAFDNTIRIRPLKTGIIDDILHYADKANVLGISRSKIREAIVLFTRRLDYLICLKSKEMRIDLEGNPVEPVTADEAERATVKIKKRIEKSTRNLRNAMAKPSINGLHANQLNYPPTHSSRATSNYSDHYPIERPPLFSTANSSNSAARPTVLVKHKATREYDPSAVARLKEKLGLSRKQEEKET